MRRLTSHKRYVACADISDTSLIMTYYARTFGIACRKTCEINGSMRLGT